MEEVIARNKDPIKDQLMHVSKRLERIQKETADCVEAEKRGRSLVILGISEPDRGLKLMSKQMELERKVCDIPDALTLDCVPVEIYRLDYTFDCEAMAKQVLDLNASFCPAKPTRVWPTGM
ncbi:hypothetical protein ANCDUO_07523 [Ancylostoma duodenale]|uniref:Uncharacterized protein n=1 Tax=Ancylostoma duodenale TaxID=51022 RepID=A0A0C2GYI2_9BILA|nr:hypothetical protein ANCDUO_07523 [Ancylostoma duodenale]